MVNIPLAQARRTSLEVWVCLLGADPTLRSTLPSLPGPRTPSQAPFLRRIRGNSPFPLVSRDYPNCVISEAPPNASQFSTALLSAGFRAP